MLLLAEESVGHGTRCVINRQQQTELWPRVLQPPVMAAVNLHQHPFLGHPLTSQHRVRRPAPAGAADAGPGQDTVDGGSAQINAFAFPCNSVR